ncbi:MAG: pyridoxal phosphate-dependent aminotransferase, partial [Proteobacteria bacterium]|nr:pyridoxal phosphate-dependent aminotransferase [Pseudomonadota bacterium]
AVTGRAAPLRAEGRHIIGLGAGEPDCDTHEHIKQAAIESINAGFTKYTPVGGTAELKRAIINKFKRENALDYNEDQILVSCGCKHSLYNLMQALLNPGDEVIIPAPYWVSYPDMARLASAEPVIINAGIAEGFKINKAQLRSAITEKSRLFIINSPSNPTGACYSEQELAELAEVLLEFPQLIIATDDIYEHILWGQQSFRNILNVCPDLYDTTVVFNGVSKAYSMTGWRIGYVGGPVPLVQAMQKIQSQSTSNATSIAQVAAQSALEGSQRYIEESTAIFKTRHDYVYDRLNSMTGINCLASEGTFYSFPNVEGAMESLEGINNDVEFAEYLLDKANVALVPGSAFGAPGYMRLSYATSMENLQKAMARLEQALQ